MMKYVAFVAHPVFVILLIEMQFYSICQPFTYDGDVQGKYAHVSSMYEGVKFSCLCVAKVPFTYIH